MNARRRADEPTPRRSSTAPAQVGFRNQARALATRSRRQRAGDLDRAPVIARRSSASSLDHSLGYAVLTISRALWLRGYRRSVAAHGEVALLVDLPGRRPARSLAAIALAVVFARLLDPGAQAPVGAADGRARPRVLYPFFAPKMFTIPLFGAWPDVATGVYMIVFVMMAVGLNIVVGYAGLLDLGYVAFYAIGAYTAAWFASLQFPHVTWHSRRGRHRPADLPGIHISIWLAAPDRRLITAAFGHPDRPADAAAARRLPRDRHARLRRDPAADRAQRRQPLRHRLQPDERAERHHADRPARLREHALERHRRVPAANYLQCCNATFLGHQIQSTDVFFWTAIVLLVFTVFCSLRLQYSRLGRAWIAIREDETAAAAMGVPLMRTKTWAYATGAFFGGVAGAYYGVVQERDVPRRLLLQHLGVHPLHGHPRRHGQRRGASSSARAFLAYLNQEGLANTGAWINANIHRRQPPPEPRRAALRLGHLRRDHPARHALPTGGPDPVETPAPPSCTRASHDQPLYDVTARPGGHGVSGADDSDDILVAESLRKEFGGLVAVNDVDFAVPRGKVVSLIGPNGAGKTTFFNMLTGVYKPTGGRDDLPRRGRHRQAAARDHRARRRAHVPEHPALHEHDGARERARRDALAAEGEPLQLDPAHAGVQARGEAGARARARAARVRAACSRKARTSARATCRTATSAGSRSRARSRPSRSCCCSTSRPPGMNPQESAEFTAFVGKLRDEAS